MRLLISSHFFPPRIGGIETVALLLATQFSHAGHQVEVLTTTKETHPLEKDWPFTIHRAPALRLVLDRLRWSEAFLHNNISLQTAWPLLLHRRPWLVATHTWLPNNFAGHLKRRALRHATNLYISQSIAAHIGHPGHLVHNPYDASTFRPDPANPPTRDLLFVGRLVSDKGADLLLSALQELHLGHRLNPALTIVGSGPEESSLRQQASILPPGQVTFAGPLIGNHLARAYQGHRLTIIPSRWAEPFGLVAIESIACGTPVLTSHNGGLPEAIGPCGQTFPNNDLPALIQTLQNHLSAPSTLSNLITHAPGHLQKFHPATIATRYLQLIQNS